MSITPALGRPPGITSGRRLIGVAALCLGLAAAALGFSGIAQASPLPADDPAPLPGPDPSTIINQANTILPVIGTIVQHLPTLLDPSVPPLDPSGTGILQPAQLGPYSPKS